MSSEYDALARAVIEAASRFDRPQTAAACSALIARLGEGMAGVSPDHTLRVLRALRKKRYFDLMERVARAAIDAGLTTPLIRRQHAQALIDQGHLSAAIDALEALVLDTTSVRPDANPPEHVEAIGLLGRAHKQAYVNAVNATTPGTPERYASARAHQHELHAAVDAYVEGYNTERAQFLWHGINTVAVVSRGIRDGIGRQTDPDPQAIAREILTRLDTVARLSYEAGVGRKDLDGWRKWVETSPPDDLGVRLAKMLEGRLRIDGALTDVGDLRAVLRGHGDVSTRRAADAASAQRILLRDDEMGRFHHAILMAFNRSELEQIMRVSLDVRLAEVSPEGSLSQVVYEVLRWAQAKDVLPRLIQALAAERPDRDDIQDLYRTVHSRS